MELLKDTWSQEVSTHALTTLGERKFNQPEILPVTEDLLKVRNYLLTEIKTTSKNLKLKGHQGDMVIAG